jgi:hypothetical protein
MGHIQDLRKPQVPLDDVDLIGRGSTEGKKWNAGNLLRHRGEYQR